MTPVLSAEQGPPSDPPCTETFIDRPQLHQSLSLPPLSSVCSQSHHNTTAAAGVLVSAAVREGSWGF
ncbi:unnamed protein product [Arctogadus glacialis]